MNRFIYVYYNQNNEKIKKIREQYNKDIYEFHKRYTKLKIILNPIYKKLKIELIGFDKTVKHTYTKFNPNKIIKDIDKMPMGKLYKKKSLSLYANYKPKTTIKGLGFKDKAKAESSIKIIKDMDYQYQIRVINTMINRAKYHPNITKGMKDAIKVFVKYKIKLKKERK